MQIGYRWIKGSDEALDAAFVGPLARFFRIDTFIQTGTYRGDTLASVRSQFSRLISIELSSEFALEARRRFAGDDAVTIIEADMARGLKEAFNLAAQKPALFWLDAHYSGGPTAKGAENTPIICEIRQIIDQRQGRDVILIDDARFFWKIPESFVDHDTIRGYPLLNEVADVLARSGHHYECFVFGDALLAAPAGLVPSPVLIACTKSRFLSPSTSIEHEVVEALRHSSGSERTALLNIDKTIEHQRMYGLGGHYYYWRGPLLEQAGEAAMATADLAFAAKCGVFSNQRAKEHDV
jgi:hypothetical protein